MKKRHWVLATVLAGSILTAGIANAAFACGGEGHHRHQGMMHVMKELNLTSEQRAAIKGIMQEQRNQMQSTREKMRDLRKSMHEQAVSKNYDANKVRELADAQAKIMANMSVKRIEMMNHIHQLLTPEQAKKLESMKRRHSFKHDRS